MGRLDLNIDNELEDRFRKTVFERKGLRKGVLTASLEEAILTWIEADMPKEDRKRKK